MGILFWIFFTDMIFTNRDRAFIAFCIREQFNPSCMYASYKRVGHTEFS